MKKYPFFLLLFLALCLSSCQQLTKMVFGIKNPDLENVAKVYDFCQKHELDTTNNQICFITPNKVNDMYIGNFPKIYIVDKTGAKVHKPDCYEVVAKTMYELADGVDIELIEPTFGAELNEHFFQNAEGQKVSFNFEEYDYHVFFFWSVWLGRFNMNKAKEGLTVAQEINKNPDYKPNSIRFVLVNFDFLEEWGLSKDEIEEQLKEVVELRKNEKGA